MNEFTIGNFELIPEIIPPEGHMEIVVKPIDMVTYWRRCGSISNFIADFYKVNKDADFHENLISTIFNELIENASKYSTKRESNIGIDVKLYNNILKLEVKNSSNRTNFLGLRKRLEKLLTTEDLDGLYLNEMVAKSRGDINSGIGLLLMLKDYNVKMGAKFIEDSDKELFNIIFQVYYFMEEVN